MCKNKEKPESLLEWYIKMYEKKKKSKNLLKLVNMYENEKKSENLLELINMYENEKKSGIEYTILLYVAIIVVLNQTAEESKKEFEDGGFGDENFEDEEFKDEEFGDENFEDEEFKDENFEDEEFKDEEFGDENFEDEEFKDEEFGDENFEDEEFKDEEFGDENFEDGEFEDENLELEPELFDLKNQRFLNSKPKTSVIKNLFEMKSFLKSFLIFVFFYFQNVYLFFHYILFRYWC